MTDLQLDILEQFPCNASSRTANRDAIAKALGISYITLVDEIRKLRMAGYIENIGVDMKERRSEKGDKALGH